jgi:hypothetical protein
MTTRQRNISKTLQSVDDLQWLHAYLQGVLDAGTDPQDVKETLKIAVISQREAGNEEVADLLLEGLDFVHGWCAPGLELPARRSA